MKNLYKKLILIKKKDYYIASLNYNLILKEYIKKDKEQMIEELSDKFVCLPDIGTPKIDFFGKEDMYLLKSTKYNKIPLTEEPFMNLFI